MNAASYHIQYGRYAKLVEEIEEKCLKKSRHFPNRDAIYETPSDYDPLALNMGQLVVHRISLRFNTIFNIIASLAISIFVVVFIGIMIIIVIMMITNGEQVQM